MNTILLILGLTVLPVLINKSTERGRFEWLHPHLRSIWVFFLVFFTYYVLDKPMMKTFTDSMHTRFRAYPIASYFMVGLIGFVLMCLYWWGTGWALRETRKTSDDDPLKVMQDFLNQRTIVYVVPSQWNEETRTWDLIIDHMGETVPALNVEINAFDADRGVMSTGLFVSGLNINPQTGGVRVFHKTFRTNPIPTEKKEIHLQFIIDDSSGRVYQELRLQRDEKLQWHSASRVTDAKTKEILLACKSPAMRLDESWNQKYIPDCEDIGLFRINALVPQRTAPLWQKREAKQP